MKRMDIQRKAVIGISLNRMAKVIGMNPGALWKYENGHRRPKPEQAARLAPAYQMTPDEIVESCRLSWQVYSIPDEAHEALDKALKAIGTEWTFLSPRLVDELQEEVEENIFRQEGTPDEVAEMVVLDNKDQILADHVRVAKEERRPL